MGEPSESIDFKDLEGFYLYFLFFIETYESNL